VKRIFVILAVSVFTVSFFLLGEAFSQSTLLSESITTTGIGRIINGDVFRAQNEAILDAQKKVLIHAVGMLMTFDLIEEQFPFLDEMVFDRPADYIESYRVLYDSTLGDRYHITIQSNVAFKELEDYLVTSLFLPSKVKLPRILLMIAQQKLKQNFYTCWWSFIDPEKELTLIDRCLQRELQKKGFEVIDHTYIAQETTINKVYGCLDVKDEAVKSLGKQFNADIVVTGNAQVELINEEDLVKKSVQASIVAKAVKVGDGSVVATLETYIPATEDDEETAQRIALENASSNFAQQMGEQISSRWVKESEGISLITLNVSGLSNYLDFSRLRSELKKSIPEIQSLSQKTLSDEGALFEIESTLDISSLVEQIRNKQFEDFTIAISNVSPAMIEMEVRPNAKKLEQKQPETNIENGMEEND